MFNYLLAEEAAATGGSNRSWIMWVIIGVVIVLMIVMTIIPQRKRQKEQQKMMDSLNVGTKLMTVGGIVGKITQVNTADNTLVINVGTVSNPTLIVIDKKAVGYVLEAVAATPAPVNEEPQEAEAPVEEQPTAVVAPDEAAEETRVEEPFEEITDEPAKDAQPEDELAADEQQPEQAEAPIEEEAAKPETKKKKK